jgi:transposase-like protein
VKKEGNTMHIPFETQLCPACQSRHRQTKAGRTVNGAQRYQCQDCKRYYSPINQRYRYPSGMREQAARWHAAGKSLRQIARDLDVNPQTVVNWLRPDPTARATSLPSNGQRS